MIGQTLGHYRIIEKIGSGGMGVVYRAHDERLDRDVAIKVLPLGTLSHETSRTRFRKEAMALSKLNHPNIATVHEFGQQGDLDFLVMEYIAGITVADKVAHGSLTEKETTQLGQQLAEGLAAAHEQGVLHRDLKPGNLRLTADGRLKILDFGLAKLLHATSSEDVTVDTLTRTQDMAGTLPYMSPEQLQGEPADARTDIYAAGVVLYEMATGRRPFEARLATALAADIQNKAATPPRQLNPQLSARLEEIILKCLDKEPGSRYQAAKELVVDMRRLRATSVAAVAPAHFSRRRLALLGTSLALLLVPILIFALNVDGLRDRLLGQPASGRIRSIAVLPLENLSHDPAQDYLAEGIQEELITDLAKLGGLKRVIARNSVMQYKGTNKTLREVAKELDVDALITGSVLAAQNRVRITAHLIEGATEKHLWADHYERDLHDVIPLQNEIVGTIARQIQLQLTPQEQVTLTASRMANPSAHEAYLRGRYSFDLRTKEGFDKALTYFQQAVEFDSAYAPAYASLAEVYRTLAVYNPDNERELDTKARAATLKALELDDRLPAAHYNRAAFRLYDLDWSGAEEEFRRAIELDANNASAHQAYSSLLLGEGRLAEAMAEIQRARELDPLSFEINQAAVIYLYYARRYDEFIKGCQQWVERDPQQGWRYHHCLGAVYVQLGRHEEGIAEFREALKSSALFVLTATELANALVVAGKREEALKELNQVNNPPWRTFGAALVYTGLGEKDEAFHWLRKAIELRVPMVGVLKVDPRFDPLRSDPRYADLLRRMGLPQ